MTLTQKAPYLPLTFIIAGLNVSTPMAFAQASDNIVITDKIVVTATGYEQSVTDAPASITVINRDQLEKSAYKDLTDALKDVPGVTMTSGGSKQDISIRGLPVQYTALLVDGKKQSGRESQPSGSGGLEQGWLPPLDAIERIEVIRGPMSTLYGSDALGGVINIITRKSPQEWHGNIRVEATLQDNPDSGNYYQGQANLAGPIIKDSLSMSLSALYQDREEDSIERGFGEKRLDNYRAGLNFIATQTDEFSLDVSKQDQKRISTSGLSLPSSSSSSETNNNRRSIALSHSANYEGILGDSYIQRESIENTGREITIDNLIANSQWSLPFDDHYLTLGASFENETLDDRTTNAEDTTQISNSQYALFGEDEWAIGDDFSLTLGLRLDDSEQFSTHLSPRLYGVWNLNERFTFKSGVSTGYYAPDLRDMSANWVQESRGGDIYGNPDLDPETSINTEAGIYYTGADKLVSSVTLFFNDFTNKISVESCPTNICGPSDARYNINIDKAITYGAEVSTAMNLSQSLALSASYTYTYSEQKTGDNKGRPLVQIPINLVTSNLDWTLTDQVKSWVKVTHRGKERQATSSSSRSIQAPSATYADIGGNWQITQDIKFMIGIYNLFDREVTYDGYGYVEDGRRYWIALNSQF